MGDYIKVNLFVDDTNYESSAKQLLSHLRPEWEPDDIKFKVFTEGITNKLFMCTTDAKGKADGIVVRIFGAKTELIIDREKEMRNMQILSKLGSGAPLYAQFNNGIAYAYVEGDCLDMDTVRDPHIGSLVAKEMVLMQSLTKDDINKLGFKIDTSPMVFTRIKRWIRDNNLKTDTQSHQELLNEAEFLESKLVPLQSPSVFSHNDLLLKNIVYNKEKDCICFIDYEYGAFNYEAFDVGNHFCEWAGIDEVDYSLYPDKTKQLSWLQTYLEHKAEINGQSKCNVTDTDVEKYYVLANKFALAAHFFWGVWALIQAKHSTIDFDYSDYSRIRLGEYFAKKDPFLSLEMPQ